MGPLVLCPQHPYPFLFMTGVGEFPHMTTSLLRCLFLQWDPEDRCEECSFSFMAPVALRCLYQGGDDIRDRLGGDAKAQGSGS